MATILKRTYRAKLPDGTFQDRACEHYTIQYRDAAGKIKRVKGYRDKGATKQLAAKLEAAVARGEQGLVDEFRESKARAIGEHLKDYLADLRATGRDDMYAYNTERRLNRLIEACGWQTLRDVEPNGFNRWRDKERTSEEKGPGRSQIGLSATTLNQFLDTARAFTNWCASTKRILGVPMGGRVVSVALAGIVKADGPKRRKRRALTDEQVAALLNVVGKSRRALVYRTGLATGLRRQELNDLQWGDVRLAAIRPYTALRAEATKARRGDRLELPATLADDLRTMRPAGAKDNDSVFPDGVPHIKVWKADLQAAGIPYKDDQGRQADFHGGTRKTLCNRLHRAGVPLAAAMRRMRHTDARLTMVDYADDDGVGVELTVLPELQASSPVSNRALTVGA